MRLLHTSDWHLGKKLADRPRKKVFVQFLNWLLKVLKEEKIDLLLIAGDVFDGTMPSHEAQELYYEFLARAVKTGCRNIVVIAGNHDSASFLEAPEHLLKFLNIYVVGEAESDPKKEVIEIKKESGEVEAVVCAIPFLKEKNLYVMGRDDELSGRDELIVESTKAHFFSVVQEGVRVRGDKKVPLIGTGHLFVAGADVSDSERQLYIGSLGRLPKTILPEEFDYVGLGHIHKPQTVGGDLSRNYSGSPIALDFSEGSQQKLVRIVDFENGKAEVRNLNIPEFEKLSLITGSQEDLETKLRDLVQKGERCLVRAEHTGTMPAKDLSGRLKNIAEGSPVEVVHIRDLAKKQYYLSSMVTEEFVHEMTPESVFEKLLEDCYGLKSGAEELDEERKQAIRELRECYQEILQEIRSGS